MKKALKPACMLGPLPPVLVSCGDMENPNILTVAWTGIINSEPPMTYVSIRPSRHSYGIIKKTREFVINLPSSSMARKTDLCGVKSGKDNDKFKLCRFTPEETEHLSCPAIAECKINIECRVKEIRKLGSHDMFIADIVGVNADESLFDEKGKIRFSRAHLLSYVHGDYIAPGKKIGSFGYSVKKKKAPPKRKH